MSVLRLWVLHDGKPGHYSQALGVARLIQQRSQRPCEMRAIQAKPKLKLANHALRFLAARAGAALLRCLPLAYRREALPDEVPDLIISFGGNVLALNVALSRLLGCSNLVVGNCYGLPADSVSVNLTAFVDRARSADWQRRNIGSQVALCKTERSHCERLGNLLWEQSPAPLWTMLVGGPGSGYRYSDDDWRALVVAMAQLSRRYGIRWLLSTSRRSAGAAEILRHGLNEENCFASIYYRGPDSPSADAFLGAGERLFCTEDSLSMLSEAVAMGKPVVSLRPARAVVSGTHLRAVSYLADQRLIERLSIGELVDYQPTDIPPLRSYRQHLETIYQQICALTAISSPPATRESISLPPNLVTA